MVEAYFVSWGCYGFWPHIDPRGSWSTTVRAEHLREFGPATTVNTPRSLALKPHDPSIRWRIKEALKYPAVTLTQQQVAMVAQGSAEVVARTLCVIYACAIMPEHVHLVIARHRYETEKLVILLKGGASDCLHRHGMHPQQSFLEREGKRPKMWEKGSWNVYLTGAPILLDKIGYTNVNPIRAGLPEQRWEFVSPYQPY